MNEDFQARLARLEAKSRTADPQVSNTPPPPPSGPRGPRGPNGRGPGRRIFLYVLGGAVALIGLPTAAVFATVFVETNKDGIASMMNGFGLLKTMYVDGHDTPEIREARRDMNGVMLRLNTGTMSQEEGEYWASPEGQMALVGMQKKALNWDAFEDKAKDIYQEK